VFPPAEKLRKLQIIHQVLGWKSLGYSLSESSDKPATKSIQLPADLVDQVEQIMQLRFERRPIKVRTELYIADLIRASLASEEALRSNPQILEIYSIDKDRVYVRDNDKDVVAELRFKDGRDLYCDCDFSKNCIHIGFALSVPAVRSMIKLRERIPGDNPTGY
jgi:hypothetical protein